MNDEKMGAEGAGQSAAEKAFNREIQNAGGEPSGGIDFNNFLISLGSSAVAHMSGRLHTGEEVGINLEMAHHTIDILAMLERKTQGNLTREEADLLSRLLYDLRVQFVHALREQRG
jgi:hypothetical protein